MPAAALPFMPRGLSRTEAARYIGIGPTLFDEMVRDGRMPPPRRANSRAIWDRAELDVFFEALPTDAPDQPGGDWD